MSGDKELKMKSCFKCYSDLEWSLWVSHFDGSIFFLKISSCLGMQFIGTLREPVCSEIISLGAFSDL